MDFPFVPWSLLLFFIIKLDIQASQELPIFVADLGQSLFDRDLLKWEWVSLAVARLIFKCNGRLQDEKYVVSCGADAFNRGIDFFGFVDCVVNRFA
jgi:hypothetical protein